MPSRDYAKSPSSDTPYHGIYVFTDPVISTQDAACTEGEQPGVGRTVDDLVGWITRQPSLEVSQPESIVIDGYQGTFVDVALSSMWDQECPGMGVPSAPVLHEADQTSGEGWDWRMSAPERWRLLLLDLGEGDVVAIFIDDSSDPSRFDELVAQAMPIVKSFDFK